MRPSPGGIAGDPPPAATPRGVATAVPFHYGFVILVLAATSTAAALGLGRFGYGLILRSMKEGLHEGFGNMGLIATGNGVGYLLFALAGGFLASRFGPRLVVSLSLLVCGLGMAAIGLADNYLVASALALVAGLGTGGANVPSVTIGSQWFAPRRRGTATGVIVGGSGAGILLAGAIVPAVLASTGPEGWRYSWFILGGIVVAIGVLAGALLRNQPADVGLHPVGSQSGGPVVRSTRAGRLQWHLVYRSRPLWGLIAVYWMFGFSYVIYATYFPSYIETRYSLPASTSGLLWGIAGIAGLPAGALWGRISDRIGRPQTMAMIFVVLAASFWVLVAASSFTGLLGAALVFGFSSWAIPAMVGAACADYVGPRLAPAALGMVTVSFGVGQALGPYLGGVIADHYQSFVPAFVVASAASVLGALLSYLIRSLKAAALAA